MRRTLIPAFLSVALIGSGLLYFAVAHEGHGNSGRQGGPGSRPATPDRQPFGPNRPRQNGHDHGGHNHGNNDVADAKAIPRVHRPHDLRTLAFRLEFAAEIVSDDVCSERQRASAGSSALIAAVALEKAARHFRTSVDRAGDGDHVAKDFNAVVTEFRTLSRLLERQRGSFLINRAMLRVDRLAGEIKHQLSNGNVIDKEHPPAAPGPPPPLPGAAPPIPDDLPAGPALPAGPFIPAGPGRGPVASQPTIPQEARGIRLLPVAEQAAALAQRTCPVTGDRLGADGKPLKVQVGSRSLFVCCQPCVDEVKSNPNAYLVSKKG